MAACISVREFCWYILKKKLVLINTTPTFICWSTPSRFLAWSGMLLPWLLLCRLCGESKEKTIPWSLYAIANEIRRRASDGHGCVLHWRLGSTPFSINESLLLLTVLANWIPTSMLSTTSVNLTSPNLCMLNFPSFFKQVRPRESDHIWSSEPQNMSEECYSTNRYNWAAKPTAETEPVVHYSKVQARP